MSMKLAVQCWECQLSHAEFKVLSALCDEADDDGTHCYPGIPYLIWKTGYDERSIQRTLRSLEEARYVEVVTPASGAGTFTEYAIHLDRVPRKTPWRKVKAAQRGGKMSPLKSAKGDISAGKGGDSIPEGVTSETERGGISSRETATLPDAIAENDVRPVVNPVKDPKDDPVNTHRARTREIRAVPKPAELLLTEQGDSASWAALVREAGSAPAPGIEHERWVGCWRDLQAWGVPDGIDDAALAALIHERARRYRRRFTTPYTTPALHRNWAALAEPLADEMPIPPPANPAGLAEALAQQAVIAAGDAQRDALLASLETTGRDQVWWGEEARRPPRLRDCWRSAIFIPPRTGRSFAVLVFPDAARLAQARASPNDLRAAGDRIATRYHGMGTVIRLVTLAELDVETGGKADERAERAERATSGESDHVAGESRAGLGG